MQNPSFDCIVELAKGEAGEEKEWRYGLIRSAVVAYGCRRFHFTSSCQSGVLRKIEVEEDERGLAWLCAVCVRLRK